MRAWDGHAAAFSRLFTGSFTGPQCRSVKCSTSNG